MGPNTLQMWIYPGFGEGVNGLSVSIQDKMMTDGSDDKNV